jgi:hypothetical protein
LAQLDIVQPQIVGSNLNDTHALFAGGREEPEFVEGASAAFNVGDFIYLTSGKLQICGNAGGLLNTQIAGLAKNKSTGVTDTQTHFEVIRPDTLIQMNIYHGTIGSAVLARAQLGVVYAIKLVSSVWVCDIESTAEDATTKLGKFKVCKFRDKIGDTYGRVLGVIVPFTQETDGGSNLRNLQLA